MSTERADKHSQLIVSYVSHLLIWRTVAFPISHCYCKPVCVCACVEQQDATSRVSDISSVT